MTQSLQITQRDQRLGGAAAAAALVSFAALAGIGGLTPVLPLLGVGLLATYFFSARIGPQAWWVHWLLRLCAYPAIIYINANRGNEGLIDSLLAAPAMDTLGQLTAAEAVIQAWRKRPCQPPVEISLILLSGITLAAACQTANTQWPRVFVPVYFCLLLVSLSRPTKGRPLTRGIAVALAVLAGMVVYSNIWAYRVGLMHLGSIYLDGHSAPATAGLSTNTDLQDTFWGGTSASRVLKISGLERITYLRAVSFDTYQDGRWGPPVENRPADSFHAGGAPRGNAAIVTPFTTTDNMILAPLNCAGLNLESNLVTQWSAQLGGPLDVTSAQPSPYMIVASRSSDYQGPLAAAPTPEELRRCLAVPPALAPRLRALALAVAGQAHTTQEKITLIKQYLMTHHQYSLTFHPGPGDPVASFLFQTPPAAAHCEFFASSSALLLRCVGVPTRYVIGYYAHEQDSPGVTVVRQRDAHAWTEAWVPAMGWVTVDATPGGGLPDDGLDSVPLTQRISEWFADEIAALKSFARSWEKPETALVLLPILISGLILVLVYRRWTRGKRQSSGGVSAYTMPSDELATLAARFEDLLTQMEIPCPADTPWQEHLNSVGITDPTLKRFIEVYNQARFGVLPAGQRDEPERLLDTAVTSLAIGTTERAKTRI